MRAFVPSIVIAAAVASCGGEQQRPLTATFPLGAPELHLALVERFPDVLTPETETWPADREAVGLDLVVTRAAKVDVSGEQEALRGSLMKSWPATLTVEGAPTPLELVELFGGPYDAEAVDDRHVMLLGHGAPGADPATFVWSEDGARWFGHALQGTHPEQGDIAKFTLLLRGRARVELAPGDALPEAQAASNVVLTVPLRYGP